MKHNYHNPLIKFIFALVFFLALITAQGLAQTIRYVKPVPGGSGNGSNWANASSNLQAMINVSASGDQVWVASGTYKPTTGTDRTISFIMKNGVSIFGGFNGTETVLVQRNPAVNITILSGDLNGDDVISGSGSSLVISNNAEDSFHVIFNNFTSGAPLLSSALLDGFTIKGGNASAYSGINGIGGGVCNYYASPTLNNDIFTGNYAEGGGGGMANSTISSTSLTNDLFLSNYSQNDGAGIFNNTSANTVLNHVTFTNNFCYGNFGGGGMINFSNSPSLTNCQFIGNFAPAGGAMANIGVTATILNCGYVNNAVFQDGGCMWNENSTMNLTNCIFSGHRAGAYGGAMYNRSANVTISNCTFFDNTAGTGANFPPYSLTGVMAIDGTNPVTNIKNSVIWGNQSLFNSTNPTITYSIVQGGWTGPGSNNLNVDPNFINPANPLGADGTTGTSDDGLQLQTCSPAMNVGNNAGVSVTDLAGNPRIFNATVDMGAYEVQSFPQPVISIPPTTTNNVLDFDGVNDYVSIVNSCGTGTPLVNGGGAITIEYWFKGNNIQSAVRLQSDGPNFVVAGWNGLHILSNDGGTESGLSVGATATNGNWHHVAMTWQQNTVNGFKTYLDGQLVAQRNSSNTPLPVINSGTYLGAYNGNSEFLNGSLDEVRIWNVTRTQAEIQGGMCGVTLPQTGLLVYYKFDHGTAAGTNGSINTLSNSVQNQFNGQLNGFALTGSTSNWLAQSYIPSWYADADGDGYGNPASTQQSCMQPAGYVANNTDCNDDNSAIFPGAIEVANGVDDNCSGQTDEGMNISPTILAGGPTTFCAGGSVALTVATGDNALQLDGTDQYMITPDLKSLFPSSSMTVELWFKALSHGVILSELGQPAVNTDWHDSQIEVLPDGHVKVRVWDLPSVDLGTVTYGTWHHVSVRYNATTQILDGTLDGVPSAATVNGIRQISAAQYWAFGATSGTNLGSGAWLNGQVDEIRIWNRALSNTQVLQNYQHSIAPNAAGLVAYYKTDETSGAIAFDATSNAKNGNLVNTPAWAIPSGKPLPGSVLWSTGATSPTINVTASGNYTATVTVSAGCIGTSAATTVTVMPIVTTPPATTNNALNFDGTDDNVSISTCGAGTAIVNGGNAITVEYWFKGTNAQSAVRFQSDANNYIVAAHQNDMHVLSNDGGLAGVSAGVGYTDGNWHHMAFTWQRNTANGFKSYLDGQIVAQRNSSDNPLPVITSGLYLGSLFGNLQMMQGTLDEVRIWNVARTQAEIQSGMCSFSLPQTGLVAYYNFDHGTADGSNAGISSVGNLAQPGIFNGQLNNFALAGTGSNWTTGAIPGHINLQGGSPAISIANGDITPNVSDNTDFGNIPDQGSLVHNFTVQNTGAVNLNVGGITGTGGDASQFTIGALTPASPVAGNGSATFTVTFSPTSLGLKSTTVHVASNDCSTGDYSFAIQGTGTCAIPAPEVRTVQNVTVTGTAGYKATSTIAVAGSGSYFTVAGSGSATFLAGARINYMPGTTIQSGGYMHGSISTDPICDSPAPASPSLVEGQGETPFIPGQSGFTLYPNPTSNNFILVHKGEKLFDKVNVEVYSMRGEKLLTDQMNGEKQHEFRFAEFPAGLYFVKIVADHYSGMIKLVKTR